MLLVNEELPKNCIHCPHTDKCNVWQLIVDEMDEDMFMDFPTPQPMQYPCCKYIVEIPHWIVRFYRKWFKGICPHICLWCKHKKECDL